jgi:hypothetical protein
MHRATKECELPESADRSIARRAESSCVSHRAAATSALDKQCLLIEVRYHHFRKFAHFEPHVHSEFIARWFHGNHTEQEADNGRTERCLI